MMISYYNTYLVLRAVNASCASVVSAVVTGPNRSVLMLTELDSTTAVIDVYRAFTATPAPPTDRALTVYTWVPAPGLSTHARVMARLCITDTAIGEFTHCRPSEALPKFSPLRKMVRKLHRDPYE